MDSQDLTESGWGQTFLSAISSVNAAMGHAPLCNPLQQMNSTLAIRILQALASGSYVPQAFFSQGGSPPASIPLSASPPALNLSTTYLVFGFNVLTDLGIHTSITWGGVVFEDPVLAVAAARFFSFTEQRPRGLPTATDYDDLWKSRSVVRKCLSGQLSDCSDRFMSVMRPPKADMDHLFSLVPVVGQDLARMRAQGRLAFRPDKSLALFEMYQTRQK